jgi:hypothetical protein
MRLWRTSQPLTGAWLVLCFLETFVPSVFAVATGVVVGQIPDVVHRGSAAGPLIVEGGKDVDDGLDDRAKGPPFMAHEFDPVK